jgi:hypothetical protein
MLRPAGFVQPVKLGEAGCARLRQLGRGAILVKLLFLVRLQESSRRSLDRKGMLIVKP